MNELSRFATTARGPMTEATALPLDVDLNDYDSYFMRLAAPDEGPPV